MEPTRTWRAAHRATSGAVGPGRRATALLVAAMWAVLLPASALADDVAAKVYLNGIPSPVYFNDGDSFRVLAGEYAGYKARLAGFNTLESHGPVHQWGDWTAQELYVLAKMATLHARNGIWHCESDLKTDGYGRTLWWCEDLAVSQVRHGYAHAMAVGKDIAHESVLAAQQDAIAHQRGIWAHGVPDFILTSTHSVTEGGGADGLTYNRLVSTTDGHSEKWRHADAYGECEVVCAMRAEVSRADLGAVVARLRADPELVELVGTYDDGRLSEAAARYYYLSVVGALDDKQHEVALSDALERYRAEGTFGAYEPEPDSCMIYVDFKRRYGGGKAACLRK